MACLVLAWAAYGAPVNILFLAGPKSHGPGEHEHPGGSLLLAEALNRSGMGVKAQVHLGWPKPAQQAQAFGGIHALVIYCDGEQSHLAKDRFPVLDSLSRAGVGIAFLHYALVVEKGPVEGERALAFLGGYYETWWSVNPVWTAQFASIPSHAAGSGVAPYAFQDEWYFHMRFRAGMQGVTPLLSAHPPRSAVIGVADGPHGSNPDVRAEVEAGVIQHVAWATETPGRGRGFGFTGGHLHANWGRAENQRLVLNALLWIAGGSVPVTGVPVTAYAAAELTAFLTRPIPPLQPWNPAAAGRARGDRPGVRKAVRPVPGGGRIAAPAGTCDFLGRFRQD